MPMPELDEELLRKREALQELNAPQAAITDAFGSGAPKTQIDAEADAALGDSPMPKPNSLPEVDGPPASLGAQPQAGEPAAVAAAPEVPAAATPVDAGANKDQTDLLAKMQEQQQQYSNQIKDLLAQYQKKAKTNNLIGGIADALSSAPSWGEFYSGKFAPRTSNLDLANARNKQNMEMLGLQEKALTNPSNTAQLLARYAAAQKSGEELKKLQLGNASLQNETDPKSQLSLDTKKQYGDLIDSQKLPVDKTQLEGKSAKQLKEYMDPIVKEAASAKERQSQLDRKDQEFVQKSYEDMNKDDEYKKVKGAVGEANTISGLIKDAQSNPASANALPVYLAKFATGGQRLNEVEIVNLGQGGKDYQDKLMQIMNTAKAGTITPENAAYLNKFINVVYGKDSERKNRIEEERAKQLSRNSRGTIAPQDALYQLSGRNQFVAEKPSGLGDDKGTELSPQRIQQLHQDPSIQWIPIQGKVYPYKQDANGMLQRVKQ